MNKSYQWRDSETQGNWQRPEQFDSSMPRSGYEAQISGPWFRKLFSKTLERWEALSGRGWSPVDNSEQNEQTGKLSIQWKWYEEAYFQTFIFGCKYIFSLAVAATNLVNFLYVMQSDDCDLKNCDLTRLRGCLTDEKNDGKVHNTDKSTLAHARKCFIVLL